MNHRHSPTGHRAGRVLGAVLAAAAAIPAQIDPACLYGFEPATPPNPEPVRYLWGGEMRHVFTRMVGGDQHTWVVGDGGIVRHRIASLPWQIQSTPVDAKWSLHDVYFLPDSLEGWAAGNGGRILHTADGGATWTLLPPTLLNCKGDPAVIWRVRFIDSQNGFANGLGMFRYTTDGGQTWSPVQLSGALAQMYEWYALELLGDANGFVGVAAGQQWSGAHCPPDGTAGSAHVFRVATNTSAMNTTWSWPQLPQPAFEDPWDIEFAPNPANYQQAVGYMSGGTGTGAGVVLRTTDSGATWAHDVTPFQHATLYGIAVKDADTAVGVGYSGTVLWRDSTPTVQWKLRRYQANGSNFTGPLGDAHWTDDASPTCVIAGSWGFLRARSDFSQANPTPPGTWTNLNPQSAETIDTQHRYFDVVFRNDLVGCAVGQVGSFVHTSDGGCSWTEVTSITTQQYILGVDCSDGGKYAVAVGRGDGSQAMLARTGDFDVTPPTLPGWTWVAEPALANVELVDVDFLAGQNVWAVGYDLTTFQPVLAHSSTAGASWTVTPLFVPDFAPTGLVCIGGREAIVIGYSRSALFPLAYEVVNFQGQFLENPIVCPPGLGGKLRDVAGRGTSLAACDVLAVGGSEGSHPSNSIGYVLEYTPGTGSTAPMLSWVMLPEALSLECTAIDMAGGGFAMVGLRQRPDEKYTEDLGELLVRSTGVNPTWSVARSRTNKTVQAIHVMSSLRAWILAKSDATDISAEFATVNDSCFLLWDPE